MKKILLLLMIASGIGAASGFLCSCNNISIRKDRDEVQDNVPIVGDSKKYTFRDFDKIEMNGFGKLYLTQDTNFSVVAKGHEEALRTLRVSIKDGVLVIDREGSFTIFDGDDQDVAIYISLPKLLAVEANGAGSIEGMNLFTQTEPMAIDISGACEVNMQVAAPQCSIESSGAGQVELRGTVPNLGIDISGAGDVDALACVSDSVSVDAAGAGEVKVYANKYLSVDASGVGNVTYKGNPIVEKDVSGVADVKQIN